MVQIIALVKPFRAQNILDALLEVPTVSISVRAVKGFGRQKERLGLYSGSEYSEAFLPKVEITLFVSDPNAVEPAIRAIVTHGRTGRMGDGKILVIPCLQEHISW